jgi:nuclear pore complex protein Nup98-Nup96
MARFRAYSTDSEEGYSSEEQLEVEEDLQRGIASRVDHQVARTGRGRSNLDSDSDSEDDAVEAEDNGSQASSSSSPRAASRPADPTLIPWAREVGVDRQKMHVMQTSLFRVPEEEAALKSISRQAIESSRRRLLIPPALRRKHSRESDGEGQRADSRQVGGVTQL